MAATTRATTPQSSELFSPLSSTPRSPTSLAPATSGAVQSPTSPISKIATPILPTISEHSVLLQPQIQLPAPEISPKTSKFPASAIFSPRRSPAQLTGVAAMADAKRKRQQEQERPNATVSAPRAETTLNPGVAAMQSLMGGGGMSKPSDAPAPDKLSEPLRRAAEKIHIPQGGGGESSNTSAQTSPVSLSSFGTMDQTNGHGAAMTATSAGSSNDAMGFVAEPDLMDNSHDEGGQASLAPATNDDDDANKAFSYPGPAPMQNKNSESNPARGMSLPGLQDSARSSPANNKRHKCPYCATDFTRHHNLKSHLLTHSQEKPYVCSTCAARFRRLHDLKRHSKLHTGEKPHTCEKCGRRFARGDALARHNKGPGGCAGTRRSSFGADDDMGDGNGEMDGIEYTNDDEDDAAASGDVHGRRVSEPSRKRVQVETQHDPNRTIYRQHSSTYPPVQQRPGDMGPPTVIHPGGNVSTSPRDMGQSASHYFQNYSHGSGITESPKPLSPGQPPEQHRLSIDGTSFGRNRSPSLTTQFQQTHFGRGSTGGRTPPATTQFSAAHLSQPVNQLPPLTLSTAINNRPNASGPGPSMLHHQQAASQQNATSNPSSASSHAQSSGSSMRDILGTGPGGVNVGGEADLWQHLRQLEGQFGRMKDEYELRISRLQEEVISLRSQLSSGQGGSTGQTGSYSSGELRY